MRQYLVKTLKERYYIKKILKNIGNALEIFRIM